MTTEQPADADLPAVAIVGMAVRVPGAQTPEHFWAALLEGRELLSTFDAEQLRRAGVEESLIAHPRYVRTGAVLEHMRDFDAAFFGFTPRDADILDPQRRMLLECSYEALECAGYPPGCHGGARVGVYAGVGASHYFFGNLALNAQLIAGVGFDQLLRANERDFAATEVSYKLNLTGPSLSVSTACSTSLLAVHLACKSLLNYECDLALAGGAAIHSIATEGYLYEEGNIFSPDGHCRAFDAQAKGTVAGSGAGMVALKRLDEALADGDHIVAIIRGSAANNDGAGKIGYTAPSVGGQAAVIAEAYALSQTPAPSITYIEAHGTGTELGDPIELRALDQVFRAAAAAPGRCTIGSLKSNIGHAGTAAGVLGLIKASLACREGWLPPTLHYRTPNPLFPLEHTAFRVGDTLAPWRPEGLPRRAGVSSFGIGGTNVHVVVEQPPEPAATDAALRLRLWPLSAKTEEGVRAQADRLGEWLCAQEAPDLARAAFTLQQGREHHGFRHAVVAGDREELARSLSAASRAPIVRPRERAAVAFLFPGQGAQHADMAHELYAREPVFREQFDMCARYVHALDSFDLLQLVDSRSEVRQAAREWLAHTRYVQPALFAVEYGLARLWMYWGLQPRMMIGHSLGEYVCACLAGVMSCADSLRLITARARLMQQLPPGAMLAASLGIKDAEAYLGADVWLAAHNSPQQVVYAGKPEAIAALERRLSEAGIDARPLRTSHAFHCGLVEPALAAYERELRSIQLCAPQLPWISNVTGQAITAAQAVDPLYWVRHMREPVNFCAGLDALCRDNDDLLLEVGPGTTLTTLARQQFPLRALGIIGSQPRASEQGGNSHRALLEAAARMWERNAPVRLQRAAGEAAAGRIPLPTYPWQRQRRWIEPSASVAAMLRTLAGAERANPVPQPETPDAQPVVASAAAVVAAASSTERIVLEVLHELLGLSQIGLHDNFFELGGDSLLATRCVSRLNVRLRTSLPLQVFMKQPTAAAIAAYADVVVASSQAPVSARASAREVGVL